MHECNLLTAWLCDVVDKLIIQFLTNFLAINCYFIFKVINPLYAELGSMLPSAVYNWNCSIPICHCRVLQDLTWKNEPGVLLASQNTRGSWCDDGRVLIFDVCIPGEGGTGQGASPSDESVRRTAHGGVQGGHIQGGRSVCTCRDTTLPGALQLCRTHPCRGGKTVFNFLSSSFYFLPSDALQQNLRIHLLILLFCLFVPLHLWTIISFVFSVNIVVHCSVASRIVVWWKNGRVNSKCLN